MTFLPTDPPAVEPESFDAWRQRQYEASLAESRRLQMDETVPGGRYLGPDGALHDANGEPLADE